MIRIHRDVVSGQCKGALLRIQVRYTAIVLFPGLIRGWTGSQIGMFAPRTTRGGYQCTRFYVHPWLAPDVPVSRLPKWYRAAMRILSVNW